MDLFAQVEASGWAGRLEVRETPEVKRIRGLARRDWRQNPTNVELKSRLNAWLNHTPEPCRPRCRSCAHVESLNDAQVASLRDCALLEHGAALPLRVGAGKTLLSLLIPTALKITGVVVLVVPAKLKPKTIMEGRDYAKHWRVSAVTIITYEELSHPNNLRLLFNTAPKCVIMDESHKARPDTKAWKRIRRYITETGTPLFFMTGSLSDRDVMNYWPHVTVAMRDHSPLPRGLPEMLTWAQALNEKIPEEARAEPGALYTLSDAQHDDPLVRARHCYRDRLLSAPGFVSTFEDVPPIGLSLKARHVEIPASLADTIRTMRSSKAENGAWQTPNGDSFSSAMDLWRHSRTLGSGLFYHWNPPAPEDWRRAQRELHTFIVEYLRYHGHSMDSNVHVIKGIKAGEIDDNGLWARWQAIEPTFVPNPVVTWLDDTLLRVCAEWLETAENERGLVWVEFAPFGRRLAEMTGRPYYAKGGMNERGQLVDDHRDGPAIVSIKCREGHNLQYHFDRSLYSVPPPKGDWVEQSLGRYHRTPGQEADEVQAEFLLTTRETYQCLRQCIRDAKMDEQNHGQPRKLSYGDSTCSLYERLRDIDQDISDLGV